MLTKHISISFFQWKKKERKKKQETVTKHGYVLFIRKEKIKNKNVTKRILKL